MKSKSQFLRHFGQNRARSKALALSSCFNLIWMPDQVRYDGLENFCESVNIEPATSNHEP